MFFCCLGLRMRLPYIYPIVVLVTYMTLQILLFHYIFYSHVLSDLIMSDSFVVYDLLFT